MTDDEIISMAEKAQMGFDMTMPCVLRELARFASHVAAAERQRCLDICKKESERALFNWHHDLPKNQDFWSGAEQIASRCADSIQWRNSV